MTVTHTCPVPWCLPVGTATAGPRNHGVSPSEELALLCQHQVPLT